MRKPLLAFLIVVLLCSCSHDHRVQRFDKDAWQTITDRAKGHLVSIESPTEKYDVNDFIIHDSIAVFRTSTGAEYTPLDSINRIRILSSAAGAESGAVTGGVILAQALVESANEEHAEREARQMRRHESERLSRNEIKSTTSTKETKNDDDDPSTTAIAILILFGVFILAGALIGSIAKGYDYYTFE